MKKILLVAALEAELAPFLVQTGLSPGAWCTVGWGWAVEYGSSDNEEQFDYLYKYSPLHNLRNECYPPTLVMTADHDDRVVPAHSFKFAAALQEHQACDNPALIRIEADAGHGAGKPLSKQLDEVADMYAFLFWNTQTQVDYP